MGLFNWLFSNNSTPSIQEPSVNIDGSPMCEGIDINGNPYGVTDSLIEDSCSFDDGFSNFDSCGMDDW